MTGKRSSISQRGATLVELIVSIVVISIGLAGVLLVIDRTTGSSGDALTEHQAIAVAEAYLEEIRAKSFCDPDNAPNTCVAGNCQVCVAAEGSRTLFDNVCDYNGLDETPPHDQNDNAIGALAAYRVRVTVLTGDSLGPAGAQVTGGNCELLTTQVRVTGPGADLTLSDYRTNYR